MINTILLITTNDRLAADAARRLDGDIEPRQADDPLFTVVRIGATTQAVDLLRHNEFDAVLVDASEAESVLPVLEIESGVPVTTGRPWLAVVSEAAEHAAAWTDPRFDDVLAVGDDARLFRRRLLRNIVRFHDRQDVRAAIEAVRHDHERLEQELVSARKEIERLVRDNQRLDEFACVVAHDLKEPLHGLHAYCEMLLDPLDTSTAPEDRERLSVLTTQTTRLMAIIGDLLTLARIGGEQPPMTEIDLNAVISTTLERIEPTIVRYGGRVRITDRFDKVHGNETLLGVAIGNLVTNGLKFNDSATPLVEIGRSDGASAGSLCIRDNGIGIAPEHHHAIFESFRRLHGRKKYEGTGLGLSIVRRILELHGASIRIDSAVGRGTSVHVTGFRSADSTSARAGRSPEDCCSLR